MESSANWVDRLEFSRPARCGRLSFETPALKPVAILASIDGNRIPRHRDVPAWRTHADPAAKKGLTAGPSYMNMNSGSYMNSRLLVTGLIIWIAATAALRLGGQFVLRPQAWPATIALFAISFLAMAWLVRRLCRRLRVPPEQWPAGAISLAAPTLLLDPFSSAFFPTVFPNLAPELAGVFGGWMLCCCAGALLGGAVRPGARF